MMRPLVMSLLILKLWFSSTLAAAAPPTATSAPNRDDKASTFTLSDQYGTRYQLEYPRDKITILVFADQRGSTQVDGWVRPLYERYKSSVSIHGVAQLSLVPRFLQPTLRAFFRRTIKFPVMLDWTGEVSRLYGYRGKQALVVVIDSQGTIFFSLKGKAKPDLLKQCYEQVDRQIEAESKKRPLCSGNSGADRQHVKNAQPRPNQPGAKDAPGQPNQGKKED